MLTALRLTNFQRHKDLEVKFTEGVNVIVGPNWGGKSTILRGILYALFGATAVPVTIHELKNDASPKAMLAELDLEIRGQKFLISRGTGQAKISAVDGKTLATGQAAVTTKVEELLGISAKSFLGVRYSAANEAATILTHGAAKFAQTLTEITGVDLIDKVLDRLKGRLATEKGVLEGMRIGAQAADPMTVTHMEDAVSDLRELVAEQSKELEGMVPRLNTLHAAMTEAIQDYQNKHSAFTREQKAAGHAELLKKQLADNGVRLEEAKDALPKETFDLAALESQRTSMAEIVKAYEAHSRKVDIAQRTFDERHQRLAEAEKAYEDAKKAVEKLEPLDALNDKLRSAQGAKDRAHAAFSAAKQEYILAETSLRSSVCPTCKRPLTGVNESELQADLQKKLKALNKAEKVRDDAVRDLAGLELEYRDYREENNRSQQLSIDVQQGEERLGEARSELSTLTAVVLQAPPSQKEWEQIEDLVANANTEQRAIDQAKDLIRSLEADIERAETALKAVPEPTVTQEEVGEAKKLQDKLLGEYQEGYGKYQSLETDASTNNASKGELERELEQMATQAKRLEEQEKNVGTCSELGKYLRTNRDRFAGDLWGFLLTEAGRFASACTSGETTEVKRTDAGGFVYVERGKTRSASQASGLQGAILGTGVKLALASAVPSAADFILFDEVSAGARDENALTMTQALAEGGHQIVLVTHRQHDATVAENVISLG